MSPASRSASARQPDPEPNSGVSDLQTLFRRHYGSIWRLLRRLGVPTTELDDATQEVFWVTAGRLESVQPGSEHAFLYGVALRVASTERRKVKAAAPTCGLDQAPTLTSAGPSPEECLQSQQALQLLDEVLERLSPDLRSVFVFYELEGLEIQQIAALHAIPVGTAASRLRRAREEFSAICRRVRATQKRKSI